MANQRIILVQTIGDLEEFYELRDKNILPLVLKLYKNEIDILKIKSFDHSPSSISVPYLYKTSARYNGNQEYLTLWENSLQELIEKRRIYIPEFIDIDSNRKYVDYILQTYHSVFEDQEYANFLCTDYRHKILFRDKKRIFEKLCSNRDFVHGQFVENSSTKNLSDLVSETLENIEKIEQNKEKIKSLFN